MTTQGLSGGFNTVIFYAELLACLFHNGRDLRVVRLDNSGEQVVCGLMVESTCENRPEPALCGVVLRCGNLKLSPETTRVEDSHELMKGDNIINHAAAY